MKEDFMISCPDFFVVVFYWEGSFSYIPIKAALYFIPSHLHLTQPLLCVCAFMFRLPLAHVVRF